MVQYISRRVLLMLVAAVATIFFAFLCMRLIERTDAGDSAESLTTVVSEAGSSTRTFLSGAIRGDLGEVPTVSGDRPVNDILWVSYANSMGLLLMALVAATLFGLFFGSLAALLRHRLSGDVVLLVTLLGISVPSFLIAALLQNAGIWYSVTFGRRLVSMGGYGWDWQHLLLPVLVLLVWPLAYITRATYLALNDILEADYIRTALAKGLRPRRWMFVHAYSNLAVPVLTAVGVSLRLSLSSLPVVEFIFGWPGVGLRALEAINDRVPLLVVAIALILGLTVQAVNLLLELAYQVADPRLRGDG